MRFGDEGKATSWCDEQFGADGSRFMDHVPELAPADHAFFETSPLAAGFATTLGQAFAHGTRGLAQDLTIEGRRSAFRPGTIRLPVHVIHGNEDTLAPLAHARRTGRADPTATLEILAGHGHVSILEEFPNIVAKLATYLR